MAKKVLKMVVVCGVALFAAACGHEGEEIQKQYAADRDECREFAEQTSAPGNTMPSGKEHIVLVSQFAHCMNKRGWAVNKPPEEVAKEAKRATALGGK